MLDAWLGKEGITYLGESELGNIIKEHIRAEEADLNHVEGIGALNFFALDEIKVTEEGEVIDPNSIIALPTKLDLPILPDTYTGPNDPFLTMLNQSGHSWVVITNLEGIPLLVIDADGFLRSALIRTLTVSLSTMCCWYGVKLDELLPVQIFLVAYLKVCCH